MNGDPTTAGDVPARFTTINHGLQPGDQILIQDTDTIPDINGIQTVTRIITDDIFEIGVNIKIANNQTITQSTRVGQIKLSLDETLTNITRIDSQVVGNIQTANLHGFSLGDTIYINIWDF